MKLAKSFDVWIVKMSTDLNAMSPVSISLWLALLPYLPFSLSPSLFAPLSLSLQHQLLLFANHVNYKNNNSNITQGEQCGHFGLARLGDLRPMSGKASLTFRPLFYHTSPRVGLHLDRHMQNCKMSEWKQVSL